FDVARITARRPDYIELPVSTHRDVVRRDAVVDRHLWVGIAKESILGIASALSANRIALEQLERELQAGRINPVRVNYRGIPGSSNLHVAGRRKIGNPPWHGIALSNAEGLTRARDDWAGIREAKSDIARNFCRRGLPIPTLDPDFPWRIAALGAA